ncbi:MAG: VOC family protein [Chloroflexi bacterium]|nr:VOC family protein [Chloroflexota bacterium]
MIQGIFHVSFTVSNLEASVRWYTEVLGLQYLRGQVQENEYTSRLVAYPNVKLKVAQLLVPGQPMAPGANHHVELIEYERPHGRDDLDLSTNNTGVGHWAFIVDDIHAEFNRMKALGVRFKADAPVAIEHGVNKGGWAIYFTDPDGITFELLQPPPRPKNT